MPYAVNSKLMPEIPIEVEVRDLRIGMEETSSIPTWNGRDITELFVRSVLR